MKKRILPYGFGLILLCFACNENNTVVNNNSDSLQASADSSNSETSNNSENGSSEKTKEELILDGAKLVINTAMDVIEKQRLKDSINAANREKMFAYQIGLQYREQDAFDAYNKLVDSGISNLYIFKISRKEYCIVKFEAKEKEALDHDKEEFTNSLGENGSEGVSIINLMDFCSKKETVVKQLKMEKGKEIKCLVCD